jgi:hypothetical protein
MKTQQQRVNHLYYRAGEFRRRQNQSEYLLVRPYVRHRKGRKQANALYELAFVTGLFAVVAILMYF